MKKHSILPVTLLLFSLALSSCIKSGKGTPGEDQPFDYEIIFADQIQLTPYPGDRELLFTVYYLSGKTEDVELWLEGIPDNVETKIEPQRIKPTSNVTITFTDKYAKPGHYPAVLHTKSTSGVKKEYPFTLTAMEKKCTDKFSGTYKGPANCLPGSNATGSFFLQKTMQTINNYYFGGEAGHDMLW